MLLWMLLLLLWTRCAHGCQACLLVLWLMLLLLLQLLDEALLDLLLLSGRKLLVLPSPQLLLLRVCQRSPGPNSTITAHTTQLPFGCSSLLPRTCLRPLRSLFPLFPFCSFCSFCLFARCC